MLRLVFASIISVLLLGHAQAATTIYTDSNTGIYAGWPDVIDPGASLGGVDGVSSFFNTGAFIAYLETPSFTTVDFDFEFTGVTGAGTVRLYVGTVDGLGGFTALDSVFFTVTDGLNNLASTTLSTYCAGLGGCDTFVVQAWTGTTFGLDSIAAGAPEPSSWALMILGFIGVAWRMKSVRYADHKQKIQKLVFEPAVA